MKIIFVLLLSFLIIRFLFRVLVRSFLVKVARNGGFYSYTNQPNRPPFNNHNNPFERQGSTIFGSGEQGGKQQFKKTFDPGGEYIDFEEVK